MEGKQGMEAQSPAGEHVVEPVHIVVNRKMKKACDPREAGGSFKGPAL